MSLPVRALRLGESAERELERNLWTDRYVAAGMVSGGILEQVKVRYRGGHTREYPKRSYEVVRGGKTYHYNAEFDDPSMIRNALSFAFFEMIRVPAPSCRHVLLSLNGMPLGVYLEIEGVEKPFFEKRGIGAHSLFYAVNNNADFSEHYPDSDQLKSAMLAGYEYRFGGSEEKRRFESFIRAVNRTRSRQTVYLLQKSLDTDNYLRWLAGAVLTGNYDGFEQNYAVYRHKRSGKYRIVPWDYEGTWGRNCYGEIQDDKQVPVTGYNKLTNRMLEIGVYRSRYRSIIREALSGPFTENKLMPMVKRMASQLAPHIREDPMRRWSFAEFLGEPDLIRRYIRVRRGIVADGLERLNRSG